MAKLTVHSKGSVFRPSVNNNVGLIINQVFQFDQNSFSKDFSDRYNGTAGTVTIKSVPKEIELLLNNVPVQIGTVFSSVTAQNLTAQLPDEFAIHNGILYKFLLPIEQIIGDKEALGYKLIKNEGGILTFIKPNNLGDILHVQGEGIPISELEFSFTTRSTATNLESNIAIFSLIPWQNVNIKPNYILQIQGGDGTPIDNPIDYFNVAPSLDVNGNRIITIEIRLADGTLFTQSYIDERGSEALIFEDLNDRANRIEIMKVGAKTFFETMTALVQPTYEGTEITWTYRNEAGANQSVSLDIGPMLPGDINIDTVEWSLENDNILQIIETDLTVHEVDFTPYEITTNINESGELEVSQKGEVKFSISKVGVSNNYLDLDNRPIISGQLPPGMKDQLYFIREEGTNEVIPDWLMKKGIVVQTQKEFEVATTSNVYLEQVFKTWEIFSHFFINAGEKSLSPPNFPALEDEGTGLHLTADIFYNQDFWGYDKENDRIFLTQNWSPYTGFVSPRTFGNFLFEATFSSDNNDDDYMALVIGFWKDPVTGYEHTLSVIRGLTGLIGDKAEEYIIVYNFSQKSGVAKIIINASPLAPKTQPNGWVSNGETRVSVSRVGDIFSIKTSQFGSSIIDDATLVTVDLNAYPELEMFKTSSRVGFGARSQQNSYFSNILFTGFIDYIFFDKGNYYETYEFDFDTEEYLLQNPQETMAKNHFGKNRFVESYLFDKLFFINENDEIICVKGDEGVSWDPFNALTEGTDLRPFLSKSLLGGLTSVDEIKYFNPNYQQDLNFLWKAQWTFASVLYELDNDPQTSDPADNTFSRIDVFALNSDGTGSIIKGVPSADPVKPSIDPLTQLEAGFILIDANSTTPNGVSSDKVYDENLQVAGGEFDTAVYPAISTRFILDSTANPKLNSKSIEGTNLQIYDAVEFTPQAPIPISQLSSFGYSLLVKSGSYNKHKGDFYRIQLYGTDAGANFVTVYLTSDPSANIFKWDSYQDLSSLIPKDSVMVNVHQIRFLSWVATSLNFGFFLDNVFLVKGTESFKLDAYATKAYSNAEDQKILQAAKDYADTLVYVGGNDQIHDSFDNMADLYASQGSQLDGEVYIVVDASAHSTVDSGYATFEYLGSTNAGEIDYRKLSEEESMDLIIGGGVTSFPDLTDKLDDYGWAFTDLSTPLISGDTSPVYATFAFNLNGFFVSSGIAPAGLSVVIDLKKNGITVLSTQAQIQVGEFTSLTGVNPIVSVPSFVKGDQITASIVQADNGTARDLKIYLDITRV